MKSKDNNDSGRVVLVTGSSRGLGRTIALRLAEKAAAVGVHYHTDREAALEVVLRIRELGKRSEAFQADLTIEERGRALIKRVEDGLGPLDILVNNVGPMITKDWDSLDRKDWESMFRGNLECAYWCLKAALPGMRQRVWGRIVNIGYSRAEQLTAFSKILPYAVAKTGLLILTRSAAAAEAAKGITVNMVSPGVMEGGMSPPKIKVPAGRLGTFVDVAAAVEFLVSEEAGYITGTHLVVAGGWKL